jgi:hypothetical protein
MDIRLLLNNVQQKINVMEERYQEHGVLFMTKLSVLSLRME